MELSGLLNVLCIEQDPPLMPWCCLEECLDANGSSGSGTLKLRTNSWKCSMLINWDPSFVNIFFYSIHYLVIKLWRGTTSSGRVRMKLMDWRWEELWWHCMGIFDWCVTFYNDGVVIVRVRIDKVSARCLSWKQECKCFMHCHFLFRQISYNLNTKTWMSHLFSSAFCPCFLFLLIVEGSAVDGCFEMRALSVWSIQNRRLKR